MLYELWEEREKRHINLVFLSASIGAGKSYFASILLWLQYFELMCNFNPQEHYNLDPHSIIAFICMSRSHKQAKDITFNYVAARFKSQFNMDYFPPNPKIKSELRISRCNMLIFPGTSNEASELGYNIYAANLDECSNLQVVEDSKKASLGDVYDPAEEWYNAAYRRMTSRFVNEDTGKTPGFISMMSSPRYPDDFIERKINDAKNGASGIFWKRAKIWEAKPPTYFPIWHKTGKTFLFDTEDLVIISKEKYDKLLEEKGEIIKERVEKVPIELKEEYELDPDRSVREYSCRPTEALYPFFRNKTAVNDAFVKDLVNPFDEINLKFSDDFKAKEKEPSRYMHIDLAKKNDSVGISMCHKSDMIRLSRKSIFTKEIMNEEVDLPVITFDFIGKISSSMGQDIILGDIREIIYEIRNRGFYVALITYDQWQSEDSIQMLRDAGFTVANLSIDRCFNKVLIDYDKDNFYKTETTNKKYIAPQQDLKDAIYEGRVRIPYHEWLLKEFFWAEYDMKANKVDHRRSRSIDVEQSVAGSFFNCVNNEFSYIPSDDGRLRGQDGKVIVDNFYKDLEGADYTSSSDSFYQTHNDLENESTFERD